MCPLEGQDHLKPEPYIACLISGRDLVTHRRLITSVTFDKGTDSLHADRIDPPYIITKGRAIPWSHPRCDKLSRDMFDEFMNTYPPFLLYLQRLFR